VKAGISPKPLFIGEAPSRTSDPKVAFSGRSGQRLANIAGLSHDEFLRRVDTVNLLGYWPGKRGKGDDLDPFQAAVAATNVLFERCVGRKLVFLVGRRVADAFGFRDYDLLSGYIAPSKNIFGVRPSMNGPTWVVLPHPSGVNRWWNDPANVRKAKRLLRSLLK
jgi:uracil-DNA glycosylase